MRFFFCLIPAVLAWLIFWIFVVAFGGDARVAAFLGLPFFAGAFGLGLQVTQPRPERGEESRHRSAQRAQAQEG